MWPQDATPDRPPKQSREVSLRRPDELCAHADPSLVSCSPPIRGRGACLDGHERLRATRELGLRKVPVRIVARSNSGRTPGLIAQVKPGALEYDQRPAATLMHSAARSSSSSVLK
jgi:hypothetical protein